MKKIKIGLAFIMMANPAALFAADADDMQVQMLNSEIAGLRTQVQSESTKLEDCAKKVKGFQIAGGVTLGLTAVGIGVNVYQAVKRDETKKAIIATDEKLAVANAKLLELKSADNLKDIKSGDTLNPTQIAAVKKWVDEAQAAVDKLKNDRNIRCDQDCVNLRTRLEQEIATWRAKLAAQPAA